MRYSLGLAAVLSFIFLSQCAFAGVGVSPASVSFENMLRGGYSERYITVSNPTEEDSQVSIGVDGPLGGWLTFEPTVFNMTGMSYRIVKVVANPPTSAPNGLYYSNILVVSRAAPLSGQAGNSISVASAVSLITAVQISDQELIQYNVEGINVPDTEECRPILIAINLRNTGNVNVTPSFNVEITSADTGATVQTYDYTSTERVLPTRPSNVIMRVPYQMQQFSCIPIGAYTAKIKSFAGSSIMDSSTIGFRVHERGALTLGGEILEIKVPKNISLGDVVKIDAIFKNTGQLPVTATLRAEIYEGGRLVSTASSDAREVMNGASDTLTAYYTPGAGGKYRVLATATFEGRSTDVKEAAFEVIWSPTYMILFAVMGFAVVGLAAWFFMIKKGRRKKK